MQFKFTEDRLILRCTLRGKLWDLPKLLLRDCVVLGKGGSSERRKTQKLEKIQLFYAYTLLSSECVNQLHTDLNVLCPPDAWEPRQA